MSSEAVLETDDQVERTLLAWRRTALSLAAAALLIGHLAVADVGRVALLATLTGVAATVAFVWLGGRTIAINSLVLVAATVLLGLVTLAGLAAG